MGSKTHPVTVTAPQAPLSTQSRRVDPGASQNSKPTPASTAIEAQKMDSANPPINTLRPNRTFAMATPPARFAATASEQYYEPLLGSMVPVASQWTYILLLLNQMTDALLRADAYLSTQPASPESEKGDN
jgi:hypothetical protein